MSGRQQSWPVPFCRQLQEQFSPGQSMMISGFIPSKGRFDVNLATGPNALDATPRDDVPLHLSCRTEEGKIVVNSCLHGTWGKEELRLKSPLSKQENFELRVRAHMDKFEIFANGKEVGEFPHKQALGNISHVCIWGEVELHSVRWEGRYYAMPFRTALNSFGVGKKVAVTGVTKDDAKHITINMKEASGDIAFHFDARFGEKKVVRGSQVNTVWQTEEREGSFPFNKGKIFDVIIECRQDGYHTFVDGKEFITFQHRIPPNQITQMTVEGELELQGVEIQ